MSLFLVFLAIAAAGAVALVASGRVGRRAKTETGRGWELGEVPPLDGLSESDPRLPPVLLPEHAVATDIDRLRFSVAFRGYRMDQVDQVLDRLRGELAARDELISELRRERHWKNDDGTSLPPAS